MIGSLHPGVDAAVSFSLHSAKNSVLAGIGADLAAARSSVLYSLAFLSNTPGAIRESLAERTGQEDLLVAGNSDHRTGIQVAVGSSRLPPTYVVPLDSDAPPPFSEEPKALTSSNGGTRMHNKFIVLNVTRHRPVSVPAPTTCRRRPTIATARTSSWPVIAGSPCAT